MVKSSRHLIDNGLGDLVIVKSRDMGATWVTLGLILWYWLFSPNFMAHLGSRKLELVDTFGDKSTLFERLRLMLEWIDKATPGIVPAGWRKVSGSCRIVNPRNGSVITGEATVSSFARQGRFNLIFCDEFAMVEPRLQDEIWIGTADAAPCRLFVSTANFIDNRFGQIVYKLKDEPKSNINMLTGYFPEDNDNNVWLMKLHWTLHPKKIDGLYYIDEKGQRIDLSLDEKMAYKLFLEGKLLRSKYYDEEVKRRTLDGSATSVEIARELDMKFSNAASSVFDERVVQRGLATSVEPKIRARLLVDRYPEIVFRESENGEVHIWELPNIKKPYGIFADCAQCLDTESDYDAFAVIDPVDNKIVCTGMGRWSVNDYAKILCLMGYYYNEALLAVEANDVGMALLTIITGRIGIASKEEFERLQKSGGMMYNRLYVDWQRESEAMRRQSRLGWRTSRVTKRAMVSGLDRLMSEGWIEIPDRRFWQQAMSFSNLPNGKVGAIAGHDDMVIAVAGAAAISPEARLYKPKPMDFRTPRSKLLARARRMINRVDESEWENLANTLAMVTSNMEIRNEHINEREAKTVEGEHLQQVVS